MTIDELKALMLDPVRAAAEVQKVLDGDYGAEHQTKARAILKGEWSAKHGLGYLTLQAIGSKHSGDEVREVFHSLPLSETAALRRALAGVIFRHQEPARLAKREAKLQARLAAKAKGI